MKIEQAQLDKVNTKLNKQNALLAVLGAAFWLIPIIIFWGFIDSYNSNFSPVMLLLSGLMVGLAVRFHGSGMTGLFSLIAVIVHSCIVLVAFSLNIVWSGTTWAFLLFGLYVAGVIIAKKVARIDVPFEEHRAFSYLTATTVHSSQQRLKNRWYLVLPTLLIAITISCYIALVSMSFFNELESLLHQEKNDRQQQQHEQNREIDTMPSALDNRSTHDILLFAYAYHSGLHFNKRGTRGKVFPRSEYKARTLLKYLIDYRNNARAKFILGFISGEENGNALLQEAAEQNDQYARIYSAVRFGCYSDENMAVELLQKLRDSSTQEHISEEVNSILYLGISETCNDLADGEFSLSYVLNYVEK